jgi:prenylcysteine oxidase/farnesylcysteine lyase
MFFANSLIMHNNRLPKICSGKKMVSTEEKLQKALTFSMPPFLLLPVVLLLLPSLHAAIATADDICIVGSGISGASTAFFLTNYTSALPQLRVFERRDKVGGRLATVTVGGNDFEAGGAIIHPKNLHVRRFAALLGLAARADGDDDWLGIWDGGRFVFRTLRPPPPGSSWLRRRLHGLANTLLLLRRYGLSLLRMDSFVQVLLSPSPLLSLVLL